MTSIEVVEAATREHGVALWPVYDAVFADHPDAESWLQRVWEPHRGRDGFRLAQAHRAGELVGFAYGYTGDDGQWWTDHAREVLAPDVAAAWLGGHFEVVSIGVVEAARGQGLGRRLLRALAEGVPHDRLLLMTTSDADDPARRLYAAEGWRVLGRGIGEGTVILGRRP